MDTKSRDAVAESPRTREGRRGRGPSPLWSKAPLVLLRYPGNLAAIILGAILLTIAAGLFPLFLSRTTSDLVTSDIEDATLTRYGAGIVYGFLGFPLRQEAPDRPVPLYERIDELFAREVAADPVLGPTVSGVTTGELPITATDRSNGLAAGRLFASEDALDHVDRLRGGDGPGVWLPDLVASHLKVKPGDQLFVGARERGVQVTIAGVYRALYAEPRTPYWHNWNDLIYAQGCPTNDCTPPAPFLIVDRPELLRLTQELGISRAEFRWQAPIAEGRQVTLDEARDLERFESALQRKLGSPPLVSIFQCCVTPTPFSPVTTVLNTGISEVITDVDRRVATVQGPGELLEAAGLFVALIVIVVAGVAAGAARRTESELLFVEGTGPGVVAAKTSLECFLPCLIGGAAGLGLAVLLSHVMASGGPIAPSALVTSAERTGLAVLAAVVLLATVAAVSFIRRTEHHRARLAVLAQLPWELAVLALAYYAFRRVQVQGAFTRDSVLNVVRPSFAILVFPILFIAGFGTLAARMVMLGLRWLRDRSGKLPSWMYLGVHRLAGGGRLTVLMIAASALCLGIFVQGQALVGSLRDTVEAKAEVFVGSDVSGKLDYRAPYPHSFPMPLTRVTKAPDAGELQPGGEAVDLLGVDPRTVAAAAYWNPEFSDTSLQDMAERLETSQQDAMSVVLVGGGGGDDVSAVRIAGDIVPVRVVASATAFPGMSSLRPTIVTSGSALSTFLSATNDPLGSPNSSTELWVKGNTGAARRALAALRFAPYPILTAKEVKDIPYIAAVIDTFVVLNLLGIAAALLVVAGILAFLQARQRSQLVSYGLSLRMGMTHERHRRSVAFELGFVLLSSLVVGVVVAIVGATLSVRHLDPFPQIPPSPLFVRPIVPIAIAVLALGVASWAGAWYANRRARATDFGEVMRLAE